MARTMAAGTLIPSITTVSPGCSLVLWPISSLASASIRGSFIARALAEFAAAIGGEIGGVGKPPRRSQRLVARPIEDAPAEPDRARARCPAALEAGEAVFGVNARPRARADLEPAQPLAEMLHREPVERIGAVQRIAALAQSREVAVGNVALNVPEVRADGLAGFPRPERDHAGNGELAGEGLARKGLDAAQAVAGGEGAVELDPLVEELGRIAGEDVHFDTAQRLAGIITMVLGQGLRPHLLKIGDEMVLEAHQPVRKGARQSLLGPAAERIGN